MTSILIPLTLLICILWLCLGFILNTEDRFNRMTKLSLNRQLLILGITYSPLAPILVIVGCVICFSVMWVYEESRVNRLIDGFFSWLYKEKEL